MVPPTLFKKFRLGKSFANVVGLLFEFFRHYEAFDFSEKKFEIVFRNFFFYVLGYGKGGFRNSSVSLWVFFDTVN